jgi:hypothetical protein
MSKAPKHEPEVLAVNFAQCDEASENDRQWFEIHSDRNYRLRLPIGAERELYSSVNGEVTHVVLVRQIAPGVRARTPMRCPPAPPVDGVDIYGATDRFIEKKWQQIQDHFAPALRIPGPVYCDAVSYAAHGMFIFPMTPEGENARPLVDPSKATRDERRLKKWWIRWPFAVVGCELGNNKLAVLEVNGEAGRRSLLALEAEGKSLPAVTTTACAGDSTRYYYRVTQRSCAPAVREIAPGLKLYQGRVLHVLPPLRQHHGLVQ